MTPPTPDDLSSFSMLDLFRLEAETQTALLTEGLLALERDPAATQHLEVLMRAAHSLKGAARMVNVDVAVRVAHAMEDYFVAAQEKSLRPPRPQIDALLQGVDLLSRIAQTPEAAVASWSTEDQMEIETFLLSLAAAVNEPAKSSAVPKSESQAAPAQTRSSQDDSEKSDSGKANSGKAESVINDGVEASPAALQEPDPIAVLESVKVEASRQAVRVTVENLNRLLSLAGESIVASRWLDTFTTDLLRLKRLQQAWSGSIHRLQELLAEVELNEHVQSQLLEVQSKEIACRDDLVERLTEVELFDRRFLSLSKRLHQEVLDCRMRPFADGIQGFPRMVRDIARALDKEVNFAIIGEATPVDRDILERIEAPLGHLLRNAVDHGVELPAERHISGKPETATVQIEARHTAGMLLIKVTDDGRGIDLEAVRQAVIEKGLAGVEVAARLNDAELLEFLFLPGFTLKEAVTEISGRGVGLDVVQTMIKEVGGTVRVTSQSGQGTHFQLQLPLTLSVIRALLAEIAGEPYAVPLNRITRTLKLPRDKIEVVEGRQYFTLSDRQIGLVTAHQVLDLGESPVTEEELAVIILGDTTNQFGLVIDRFLGELELTVRALDPRLGKVQDISAAALLPDQSPVLIIDVDDLMRSIENLVSGQRLAHITSDCDADAIKKHKRVLVVDDSLTVRELERKLIASRGYEVEVAVDGVDAWNAVRTGHYDLVVTDVDMPRMDGIELVTLIKKDPRLHALPVMIVSYKDRARDRQRGLDAGADYYLAKGSFHDETLLEAVIDLIGEAQT